MISEGFPKDFFLSHPLGQTENHRIAESGSRHEFSKSFRAHARMIVNRRKQLTYLTYPTPK